MAVWISVDPGLHTGIAIWDSSNNKLIDALQIVTTYKFGKDPYEAIDDIVERFLNSIKNYEVKFMYIEGVEIYGTLKSQVAASRGDLSNLAYLVGAYCGALLMRGIPFTIKNPSQWKGQLTKEATKRRVFRALSIDFSTEHIIDAVALGLSIQEKL